MFIVSYSGFFVISRNIEDRRYRINNNTFKYRCTKKSIRYLTINIKDREPIVLEKNDAYSKIS